MRLRVAQANKAKQVPLSLYPRQQRYAVKRANQANLTFSRYIQKLIELDEAQNILPTAMTHKLTIAS